MPLIPTRKQPLDATLSAFAAITTAADKLIYATGVDTFATADLTSYSRSLLDDANAAAARSTLGLVIGTDVAAQSSLASYLPLAGGALTGPLTGTGGVIEQRDGTTAQTQRVFGTYTDASNYVRAALSASSSAVTLAAETAGTGADNLHLILTPAGTGGVGIGTTSPAAYTLLDIRGSEDSGNGVGLSLRNLSDNDLSIAILKLAVGPGGAKGALLFSSQTSGYYNYGIVDGFSLRTLSGSQEIAFSTGPDVLTGTGLPSLIIKASQRVGIGTTSPAEKLSVANGNILIATAGYGLSIKEGTNARMGIATLVAGTVVVSTTAVTANSRIFLEGQDLGTITLPVGYAVSARTAGTSFTILSASIVDTSNVAWTIIEPA